MRYLSFFAAVYGFVVLGAEVPAGLVRSAEVIRTNTYEFVLSPSYTFNPSGGYLSSEIRYQANEDFGAGFNFGAGEAGLHFGVHGMWYVLPDLARQPGFSVLGGLYFNRLVGANYFNVKVAPMASKSFKMGFGKMTPYTGIHFSPSFRLGEADNSFAIKASFGSEFLIQSLNGMKLFTEFNLGLTNSPHSIQVGFSYPFVAL